jgi:hypothetical protein
MTFSKCKIMKLFFLFCSCINVLISCKQSDIRGSDIIQNSSENSGGQDKCRLLLDNGNNANNDSTFIWSGNVKEFNKCKIIRIKDAGWYKYFFWNTGRDELTVFLQDSIPIVEFISDTLYDVNGDNSKDLLINGKFMNGQCSPKYSMLFCFDSTASNFTSIKIINNIPNPKFFPSSKLVTGEIECMMKKDIYKFKWVGLELDTISIVTKPLN